MAESWWKTLLFLASSSVLKHRDTEQLTSSCNYQSLPITRKNIRPPGSKSPTQSLLADSQANIEHFWGFGFFFVSQNLRHGLKAAIITNYNTYQNKEKFTYGVFRGTETLQIHFLSIKKKKSSYFHLACRLLNIIPFIWSTQPFSLQDRSLC